MINLKLNITAEVRNLRSKINDEPVEKFVGIQVLKGQVKTDDTSDDRIWCMEKTPGDNIWTADEFYKSNGKGIIDQLKEPRFQRRVNLLEERKVKKRTLLGQVNKSNLKQRITLPNLILVVIMKGV